MVEAPTSFRFEPWRSDVMSKHTKSSASARDEIERALRQLPMLHDKETRVPALAAAIAQIADQPPQRKRSNAFEGATQETIEREIKDIIKLSIGLANTLDSLHAPSIQALANAVPLVDPDGTPTLLNVAFVRSELPKILRVLAQIAKGVSTTTGDLSGSERGNKPNLLVHAVAQMVARIFFDLTGEKPDRSQGPCKYKALLANIFDVLKIKANVDRATKDAVATLWPE
jgi:hypothetical protein